MIMWIRNKLFGTKFACVEYGYDFKRRKVRRTPEGQPYVRIYGDCIPITEQDKFDGRYRQWFWIYK